MKIWDEQNIYVCFHNNFGGYFKFLPEVVQVKRFRVYQYINILKSEPGPGAWAAMADENVIVLFVNLKTKITHCVTAASNNGFVANFASSLCKLCQFVVLVKEIRPQSSTARTSGSLYCSRYHTTSSLGFRGRGKYSCNNITTTLIQISRLFYFGFFSKTNHQMII